MRNKSIFIVLVLIITSISSTGLYAQSVRFVKPVSQGTGDGSSWSNASSDLAAILSASHGGDAVWVAAGTYKPGNGTDRYSKFNVPAGVSVFGGFAGTETSMDQRTAHANETILSGDIGMVNYGYDNSIRIMETGSGIYGSIIDGFTLQDAYSPKHITLTEPASVVGDYSNTSAQFGDLDFSITGEVVLADPLDACTSVGALTGKIALIQRGGCPFVQKALNAQEAGAIAAVIFNNIAEEMVTLGGTDTNIVIPVIGISMADGEMLQLELKSGHTVSLIMESGQYGGGICINPGNVMVSNCLFQKNNALGGSAVFIDHSSAALKNCRFVQNQSDYGTVYLFGAAGDIDSCSFTKNESSYGGGIFNDGSLGSVKNCEFDSNKTAYRGGAIYNGGALTVNASHFSSNEAIWGGAIHMQADSAIITNSYIARNKAKIGGGGISVLGGKLVLEDCFFYSNEAVREDPNPGTGGAIHLGDTAVVGITNCVFSQNAAKGRADFGGGAIAINYGSVALNKTTMAYNSSDRYGGAISLLHPGAFAIINNAIVWNNTADEAGTGGIYNDSGWVSITYSDIQNDEMFTGEGVIYDEPLFVNGTNPLGDDGIAMTADDGLRLMENSPAINKGDPSTAVPHFDILGNQNVAIVDMGAYEFLTVVSSNRISADDDMFWVFPVPATSFIDLKGKDDFSGFVISNSLGQIIRSGDPADFPLDISTWDRGICVIRLEKEGEIITRKLIIR